MPLGIWLSNFQYATFYSALICLPGSGFWILYPFKCDIVNTVLDHYLHLRYLTPNICLFLFGYVQLCVYYFFPLKTYVFVNIRKNVLTLSNYRKKLTLQCTVISVNVLKIYIVLIYKNRHWKSWLLLDNPLCRI